jgi:hypothetical protein
MPAPWPGMRWHPSAQASDARSALLDAGIATEAPCWRLHADHPTQGFFGIDTVDIVGCRLRSVNAASACERSCDARDFVSVPNANAVFGLLNPFGGQAVRARATQQATSRASDATCALTVQTCYIYIGIGCQRAALQHLSRVAKEQHHTPGRFSLRQAGRCTARTRLWTPRC